MTTTRTTKTALPANLGEEDEESKVIALKSAIQKGLDSPRVENFEFKENLRKLKEQRRKNG